MGGLFSRQQRADRIAQLGGLASLFLGPLAHDFLFFAHLMHQTANRIGELADRFGVGLFDIDRLAGVVEGLFQSPVHLFDAGLMLVMSIFT